MIITNPQLPLRQAERFLQGEDPVTKVVDRFGNYDGIISMGGNVYWIKDEGLDLIDHPYCKVYKLSPGEVPF